MVIDTSFIVSRARRRLSARQVIAEATSLADVELSLSVITVAELTHGVVRARDETIAEMRRVFVDDICFSLLVHPVSIEIARLAGQLDGELTARGVTIGLPDLLIGASAIHHGETLLTLNTKHFQLIPGLTLQDL